MIPVCLKVMAYSNRLLWVRNCSSLPAGMNKRHVFYWVLMDHVLRYSVDRRDCHQAKRRSKYLEIWSSRNKLAGQLLYSDKSIRFKLSGLLSQPHSAKRNQLHRRSTIAIHCLYCLCETCLVLVMWHKLWTVWEQYFLHVSLNTPQLIAKRCITWLIPAVSWPWEENKWRSAKRAKLWPNWRQGSLRRAPKCCISPASLPIRSLTHHASHMPQLLKHPQMSGQQNAMICHGCICESECPSMSFSCCCQGAQSQKNNIAVERSSDLPKSSIHQPFCSAALQLPSFPSTNNCV